MNKNARNLGRFRFRQSHLAVMVSSLVGIYGLYIITTTLLDQFQVYRLRLLNSFIIDIHLLLGLGFVYLSILLLRRKRNAFYLALAAFAFLLGEGSNELFNHLHFRGIDAIILIRYIIMPVAVVTALLLAKDEFKVKSDQAAFKSSIKLAVIVLIITLGYGVGGFMLMDKSDFHQEINFSSALHHTVDQFDLTTNRTLHPYTRRAKLFMDSLSFVSTVAIIYLVISLFQPVRLRLSDQTQERIKVKQLMEKYTAPSEDFFKLWPHDKHYFFNDKQDAALAYRASKGVALILADPVGNKASFADLYKQFHEMCWANDWQPALIHIDASYADFYRDNGYQLQLIGQEAIVDINQFVEETARNKYFRNIRNRFVKENYSVEIISPPHHKAMLDRLKSISDEWLEKPGRTERGFVMGYFSDEYVQQCDIVVVRDAAQTIRAFLNLIPSTDFNSSEVTYDMLRGVNDAPPNINDFLLMQMMIELKEKGFKTLNMGLSPLVGLDEADEDNSLISNVLRFAYVNGDRFYSFSGLHRFKDKYEPAWEDRFLGFKGGVRGFTKMLNALVSAMKPRTLKR